MKRGIAGLTAALVLLMIGTTPASADHISPEYFAEGSYIAGTERIGHRHHNWNVSARVTGGPTYLCVDSLDDNDRPLTQATVHTSQRTDWRR